MSTLHGARTTAQTILPLLLAALLLGAALQAAAAPPQDRLFDVFLDDRRIGEHSYSFARNDTDLVVISEADFRVKLMFVTVYRYEHRARETWRDGCLVALTSTTNDDGTPWQVSGQRKADAFVVDDGQQTLRLDESCVWSFAYWNPALIQHDTLLNAQTGVALPVSVEDLGSTQMTGIGGAASSVDRASHAWRLQAEDFDATLHYNAAGDWLGLDSAAPGDRTIHYRPAASDPLAQD